MSGFKKRHAVILLALLAIFLVSRQLFEIRLVYLRLQRKDRLSRMSKSVTQKEAIVTEKMTSELFVEAPTIIPKKLEHPIGYYFLTSSNDTLDEDHKSLIENAPDFYNKRLPNIIMLGAKKCGTSAFREFLSAHRKIIVSRTNEPHFFDYFYDRGVNSYLEHFRNPIATDDLSKSLFEKSVNYIWEPIGSKFNNGSLVSVPEKILRTYKNYCGSKNCQDKLQLIVMLCDPSLRVYSDYVHDLSIEYPNEVIEDQQRAMESFGTFEDYVEKVTKLLDDDLEKNLYKKPFAAITKGLYILQIKEWLNYFPLSQFTIINGDEIIQNPGKVMRQAQKDLGLDIQLTERGFIKIEDSGHFCYRSDRFRCLDKRNKGRTRDATGSSKMSDKAKKILNHFYRRYNKELFELFASNNLAVNFDWVR